MTIGGGLMAERKDNLYYWGLGRRKSAVVRVRLKPGGKGIFINNKPMDEYMDDRFWKDEILAPLRVTDTIDRFAVYCNARGGGKHGQAGAIKLGIARALCEASPELRPVLKKAGFLTRDPRVVERKKYGLKKARKRPQFSKR